jgi:hypothetical protein
MQPTFRLYSPTPHPYRHDLLAAIGAPDRPGIFEPSSSDLANALCALAAHKVGAVDPVPWPFLGPVWWALKRVDGAWVGPAVHFPAQAIQPPQLPPGGMAIAEVVENYIRAVPGTRVRRISTGRVVNTDLLKDNAGAPGGRAAHRCAAISTGPAAMAPDGDDAAVARRWRARGLDLPAEGAARR